jgi:predicted ATPase
MQPGSLIAIDEFENTLHPYAIQVLIDAFRDWAYENDLTICMATHSPVVLDEFKDEPEKVFVIEHGLETVPMALTELCNPDWLAHFTLGRLFAHGDFGGQRAEKPIAQT